MTTAQESKLWELTVEASRAKLALLDIRGKLHISNASQIAELVVELDFQERRKELQRYIDALTAGAVDVDGRIVLETYNVV
jgi:hypothetical protein